MLVLTPAPVVGGPASTSEHANAPVAAGWSMGRRTSAERISGGPASRGGRACGDDHAPDGGHPQAKSTDHRGRAVAAGLNRWISARLILPVQRRGRPQEPQHAAQQAQAQPPRAAS
jgi:hypothetical protein